MKKSHSCVRRRRDHRRRHAVGADRRRRPQRPQRRAPIGPASSAALIIGGAIANSQPRYYAPEPGYVVYDGYRRRYPVSCPGGYWARRPVYDRWGNVRGWSRPRFICP